MLDNNKEFTPYLGVNFSTKGHFRVCKLNLKDLDDCSGDKSRQKRTFLNGLIHGEF